MPHIDLVTNKMGRSFSIDKTTSNKNLNTLEEVEFGYF